MEVREPPAKYLVQARYKQTEVGVIPNDWQVGLLAEFAQIRTGIAKNANASLLDPIEVPYLRVANVQDGYLDLSELSTIKIDSSDLRRFSVLPDDVLMNEGGDLDKLGRGALWRGEIQPCVHQNHVFVVRCRDGLLPEFLNAWTSSPVARRYFLLAGRQTTNLASINKTSLGQLPVPVPARVVEQQAIAEALGDADALIDSLEHLLAKKRQIKQGAMRVLLTGQQRLPGFVGEWECKLIGQFTDCTAGGTPSTSVSEYWGGAIRWMNSGDLNLKTVTEVEGRITDAGLRNSSTKLVPAGCVLIGLAGQGRTRGTVAINLVPLCTNQSIAAIFPNDSFDSRYLYYNLDRRYDELRVLSAGDGGRGGLNLTIIRSLSVPFPPIQEQSAIAAVLSDMDAEVAALEARLAKARQVKQGMVQALLTGRIRLV